MGILTALYRLDSAVFEQVQSENHLPAMMDSLIGLRDDAVTFEYDRLSMDKAWQDFGALWKGILPTSYLVVGRTTTKVFVI